MVVQGEGIDEYEAKTIYQDVVTNKAEVKTQARSGKIRVHSCTYKDNRCFGVDLRLDKSREHLGRDERGHIKDYLHR